MAESIIADVHGRLLRGIAEATSVHFQGLRSAAAHLRRAGLLDGKLAKKLATIDCAFAVSRHITSVSANLCVLEILSAIKLDSSLGTGGKDLGGIGFGKEHVSGKDSGNCRGNARGKGFGGKGLGQGHEDVSGRHFGGKNSGQCGGGEGVGKGKEDVSEQDSGKGKEDVSGKYSGGKDFDDGKDFGGDDVSGEDSGEGKEFSGKCKENLSGKDFGGKDSGMGTEEVAGEVIVVGIVAESALARAERWAGYEKAAMEAEIAALASAEAAAAFRVQGKDHGIKKGPLAAKEKKMAKGHDLEKSGLVARGGEGLPAALQQHVH
jgi:hypothetical protein